LVAQEIVEMVNKDPKLIVDIDNTITIHKSSKDYAEKSANLEVIQKLHEYRNNGFEIILFTARNMYTHQGDLSKINAITAPVLIDWLAKHNVPYDGLIFGKPWCGEGGFYIDDKAIRPSEFIGLSYEEIKKLIE
jgi:capsule biosynthesis phosphatase